MVIGSRGAHSLLAGSLGGFVLRHGVLEVLLGRLLPPSVTILPVEQPPKRAWGLGR